MRAVNGTEEPAEPMQLSFAPAVHCACLCYDLESVSEIVGSSVPLTRVMSR